MAKETVTVEVAGPPLVVFRLVGSVLAGQGLQIVRQDGWALTAVEGLNPLKMGLPVTIVATVDASLDGVGRSRVTLDGSNFGWGLNTVHLRRFLKRVAESLESSGVPLPTQVEDDPNLPPRVG